VKEIDTKAGFLGFSHPKITMNLIHPPPIPVEEVVAKADPQREKPISVRHPPGAPDVFYSIMLSFNDDGRDNFLTKLGDTLKSTPWKALEVVESKEPQKQLFTTSGAGLAGIIRKVQTEQAKDDHKLDVAFTDLSALMTHAKDIVVMAEKYAQSSEAHNSGQKEQDDFSAMLHNMGIPSPVTRSSAGAAYHVQLSRQLADFLSTLLEKQGGLMMMTEVYYAFNRARGTELISPDDLLRACELFPKLGAPMKLRKFSSGVLVVQSEKFNDKAMSDKILEMMNQDKKDVNKGSLTALELSQLLGISIFLAKQHLLTGEQNCHFCRDESVAGLRFFPNIFLKKS